MNLPPSGISFVCLLLVPSKKRLVFAVKASQPQTRDTGCLLLGQDPSLQEAPGGPSRAVDELVSSSGKWHCGAEALAPPLG